MIVTSALGWNEPNEKGRIYQHGTSSAYAARRCRGRVCRWRSRERLRCAGVLREPDVARPLVGHAAGLLRADRVAGGDPTARRTKCRVGGPLTQARQASARYHDVQRAIADGFAPTQSGTDAPVAPAGFLDAAASGCRRPAYHGEQSQAEKYHRIATENRARMAVGEDRAALIDALHNFVARAGRRPPWPRRPALVASAPAEPRPGVVVFDERGEPESISGAAQRWIGELVEDPPPQRPGESKIIQAVAAGPV